MAEFKIPTETVELPSKGLLYPKDSPLAEGKIELKYMTAKEEDILTNQNYIRQGTVIDKLLQSLIVTKINYNDLLVGDKNAIMVAARILSYGSKYNFVYDGVEQEIDLSSIDNKPLSEEFQNTKENNFTFTLPHSGNVITFKLLTQKDDGLIDKEIEGYKKLDKLSSRDLTTRMKYMILSVNGDTSKSTISSFVDNAFLAKDAKAFREYYNKINPGINTTIQYEFIEGMTEDLEIPINANFFWPE